MTDPIGTAQERELIEIMARAMMAASRPNANPDDLTPAPRGQMGMVPKWQLFEHLAVAAYEAALQSRIAEVGRLEAALGNTLDLIDELYRRHGVELEPDEVAVAQNARAALSLQRRV